jgi:hypothetical protein
VLTGAGVVTGSADGVVVDGSDEGAAAGLVTVFGINDWFCLAERWANDKEVTKKMVAKIVVIRIMKLLVLAPNMDSAPANCSVKPPPRPDCIKIAIVKSKQTKT